MEAARMFQETHGGALMGKAAKRSAQLDKLAKVAATDEAAEMFRKTHGSALHGKGGEVAEYRGEQTMPVEGNNAIFYSLTQRNTGAVSVPLTLATELKRPLVEDMGKWSVSVIRFHLPFYDIPLFTLPSTLNVRVSYNGAFVAGTVVNDTNITGTTDGKIYELQVFVLLVNNAITVAFNALAVATHLPLGAAAPILSFDPVTQLFTIAANLNDYGITVAVANRIQLALSPSLTVKLGGFPMIENDLDTAFPYTFIFADSGTNTSSTTHICRMTQEGLNLNNIIDADGVVIQTTLPVSRQWAGSDLNTLVMTDFMLNDATLSTYHSPLGFSSTVGPNRQIAIEGSGPLQTFSCPCFVINADGSLSPMSLPPNSSASILFMFRPKATNPY